MASLGENVIKSLPPEAKVVETVRLRRTSGAARAAADKREQAKVFNQVIQGYKLTGSSVDEIGFQVLFPLLFVT